MPCSSSGLAQWRRLPLRRADLPAGTALLGPELDRLISHQLPAMFEQRWLPAGHYLSKSHLQALAPAVVAAWLEMEHLAAIAEPALLGGKLRTLAITDVHGRFRPPPAPSPAVGSGRRSSPGNGWLGARHGRLAPGAAGNSESERSPDGAPATPQP